ncbi:MAG: hypothetical protein Q7T86_13270 [Hyphomicrobiaceae bacterium]|nr:hypothetical protein [Hyphomicrobiaceae bacterium]
MIRQTSWRALLLAAGTALAGFTPANAADLGGNCCADLEERIAELEATTARKGNRKVSLEIGGQVNEAVLFWDDGGESNAYVVTNDNARTRFRFKGKAKINADWEAGYALETGVRTANSKRFTQDNPKGNDTATDVGFDLRDSYWFLKSKTYGGVSVGFQADASDAITEINLTQTKDFAKLSDMEDTGLGLTLRSSANGQLTTTGAASARLSFRRLIGDAGDQPGDGDRRHNLVKYETPVFAGFTGQASWGEDDVWDLGLRYAGEFGGFKVAAGVAYGETTDGGDTNTSCNIRLGTAAAGNLDQQCSQFGGSVSVLHEATGLFASAGAGIKTDDLLDEAAVFAGQNADDEQTFYAFQAGLERKFIPLGKTTIFGEYYNYEGGANNRRGIAANDALDPFGGSASAIWSTGLEAYGFGIAQGIDNAAMVLYLNYRHVEGELTLKQIGGGGVASGPTADVGLEDLDLVQTGAIIKF